MENNIEKEKKLLSEFCSLDGAKKLLKEAIDNFEKFKENRESIFDSKLSVWRTNRNVVLFEARNEL